MLTIQAGDSTGISKIAGAVIRETTCITSLDIMGKKAGDGEVRIYHMPGSYEGFEEDGSGWELVFDEKIAVEKGTSTTVEFDPVCVLSGQSHSFYIYSQKGLLFTKGNGQKRVPFDGNGELMIMEGMATKKEFDQLTGDSQYIGAVG